MMIYSRLLRSFTARGSLKGGPTKGIEQSLDFLIKDQYCHLMADNDILLPRNEDLRGGDFSTRQVTLQIFFCPKQFNKILGSMTRSELSFLKRKTSFI